MTLVIASNFGEGIALMTSDTREVFTGYWLDLETGVYTAAEQDSIQKSTEKNIKARFLTKYVMLGTAGISDLCRHFLREMTSHVHEENDLEDCYRILNKLVQDARKQQNSNNLFSFLNQKNGLYLIINGFTRDGRSGTVLFSAGTGTKVEMQITPSESAQWTMTVDDKYSHLGPILVDDISDGQAILNKALTVHAKIAFKEPEKISSECHCYMMFFRENGEISTFQYEFDTAVWHEQLKELDEQ